MIKPLRGTQLDKSHPLNRGLVGFWLFNEGDGKKVFDLSGNGNHGELKNMAFPPTAVSGWNAGRKGVGLRFDSTDDYVDCGNNASLIQTGNFSVCVWFKSKQNGVIQGIVSTTNNGESEGFSISKYSNDKIYCRFGGNDSAYSNSAITDTDWHFVVINIEGTLGTLYLDGIKQSDGGSNDGDAGNIPHYFAIGRYYPDYAGYRFNGQIDQVRIYSRALSAEEVKMLYLYPYGKF